MVLVCIYIYISVLVSYQVFARGLANGSGTPAASPVLSRASTQKLVDGSADRPFVFRRLVPEIIGVAHRLVPGEAARNIDRDMAADTTRYVFPGAAYHQANLLHSIAFYVWLVGLTGFALVMRWLFRLMQPDNRPLQALGPALCLLGVGAFGYVNFYVYDAFTPLMISLSVAAAMSKRSWLSWLLLVPAAYHKETAVVLPVIYAAFAVDRVGIRPALLAAACQLAVVVVVLAGLRIFYGGNPGDSLELHLASNWHALTHPKLITLMLLAAMVGTGIAVHRALPTLSTGLRRCCMIMMPIAVTLYLVTGMLLEIRSLLELWPLLCLVLIPPLFRQPPRPLSMEELLGNRQEPQMQEHPLGVASPASERSSLR